MFDEFRPRKRSKWCRLTTHGRTRLALQLDIWAFGSPLPFLPDVIADPALDFGKRHGRLAAGAHPAGAVADLEGLGGLDELEAEPL